MVKKRVVGLAALLLGTTVAALPASADPRPVVVELFTSQGCSSCPPADEYLGEMTMRGDIIPLAFHVDYWNYIGWTDPFASKQMTHRQKAYSRVLGQRYIYTPEMVVNGTTQEVGSNRHGVEALIEAARKAPPSGPSISLTREEDGRIRLRLGRGTRGPTTTRCARCTSSAAGRARRSTWFTTPTSPTSPAMAAAPSSSSATAPGRSSPPPCSNSPREAERRFTAFPTSISMATPRRRGPSPAASRAAGRRRSDRAAARPRGCAPGRAAARRTRRAARRRRPGRPGRRGARRGRSSD